MQEAWHKWSVVEYKKENMVARQVWKNMQNIWKPKKGQKHAWPSTIMGWKRKLKFGLVT